MAIMHILRVHLFVGATLLAGMSVAQTEPHTAESQLKAILAKDPQNDIARERLTVLLLNANRSGAASYHARYLSRKARSRALRDEATKLFEKLEGPSWGWQPILSFTPSSNLNKGSTQSTVFIGETEFSIDPDSRAKDGIGLTFGASVWKTWRPSETWYARWNTDVTATIYDNDEMDARQGLRTSLAFSRQLGNGTLELGGTFDATFKAERLERRLVGPSIARTWQHSDRRQVSARLEILDVHYPNETFRSGHRSNLTLGWTETISPSLRLSFGLPLALNRTGRAHLDYNSYGANIVLNKLWNNSPWRTSVGIGVKQDKYLGNFPGAVVPRNDNVKTISIGQSNQNWSVKGFVPELRYVYTRSKSNISLYDYDSNDIQVTFQKRF